MSINNIEPSTESLFSWFHEADNVLILLSFTEVVLCLQIHRKEFPMLVVKIIFFTER